MMIIREFTKDDLPEMISIWNEIVEEGNAFPQEESLTLKTGFVFLFPLLDIGYCSIRKCKGMNLLSFMIFTRDVFQAPVRMLFVVMR